MLYCASHILDKTCRPELRPDPACPSPATRCCRDSLVHERTHAEKRGVGDRGVEEAIPKAFQERSGKPSRCTLGVVHTRFC